MTWEAHTAFVTVDVGTRFALLETPQVDGIRPTLPPNGTKLLISIVNTGAWVTTAIVAVSPHQIDFAMPDGTIWRMTPRQPSEHGSSIHFDMHYEEWIVREQVL